MPRLKVFLDTDIGTDSDDACCLAYLLSQPDCELLGVSTVGPDSPVRAQLAELFCRHLGQAYLPIGAGAPSPLYPNYYWPHHRVNQHTALERWPVPTRYAPGEALPLMRDVIRAHPGEVTLLTIGPLTNAALLATADPETAALVKTIVIMGGRFTYPPEQPQTECNIMLDPTAAGSVFHFPWRELRILGLDTSGGLAIPAETFAERCAGQRLEPLLHCCRQWWDKRPRDQARQGVHDPLTAATLFAPELCSFTRGRISTKLCTHDLARGFALPGDAVTGALTFTPEAAGPHQLAGPADRAAVHEHLLGVLAP